jgi:hypothetical protein
MERCLEYGLAMTGIQIDTLCRDWLEQNYGGATASRYRRYSLVMPTYNDDQLNEAIDDLMSVLCILFGAEETFKSTDYCAARVRFGLSTDESTIPDMFLKVFKGGV